MCRGVFVRGKTNKLHNTKNSEVADNMECRLVLAWRIIKPVIITMLLLLQRVMAVTTMVMIPK